MSTNINIKFNKDYRGIFKAGQEVVIPTPALSIMYLVGPNGCGKSTLLRSIRTVKDTLEAQRLADFDGCRSTRISDIKRDVQDGQLEIAGLDQFSHVFAFDVEADSNNDVLNAYSAGGFVASGGLACSRMSRGQGVLIEFAKFYKRFAEIAAHHIKDENWRPLVIIDEIDEGLDIRLQFKWNELLTQKFCLAGATVLVVSHNPICMMSWSPLVHAFNVATGEHYKNTHDYIENLTGYKITIDESGKKSIEEQLKFNKNK